MHNENVFIYFQGQVMMKVELFWTTISSKKIEFSVIDKHIICIDCIFQVNVVRRAIMLITTLLEWMNAVP